MFCIVITDNDAEHLRLEQSRISRISRFGLHVFAAGHLTSFRRVVIFAFLPMKSEDQEMVLRSGRERTELLRSLSSVLLSARPRPNFGSLLHVGCENGLKPKLLSTRWTYATHAASKGDHMDSFGSWAGKIDLNLEESVKRGKLIPRIEMASIGYDSKRGKRKYQEDRCLIAELNPDMILAAVFDGHGGDACAQFASENFVDHIKFWLERDDSTHLDDVLARAFTSIDKDFAAIIAGKFNRQDPDEVRSSGSTATVAVIRLGRQLAIAHVGDSRAILCRNGEAMTLTRDHVPTESSEIERITNFGGRVVEDSYGQPKVNGRLSMSRSLGDIDLKKYGVVPVPDTRMVKVKHGIDSFLVLTTDGVCSVMTDQEICDTVSSSSDPWTAAKNVNDQAAAFNSSDNTSTVVVPFGSWGASAKTTSVFYSYGRNFSCSSRFG